MRIGALAQYCTAGPGERRDQPSAERSAAGSSEKQVGASPLAWLKHPMSHLPRPLPAHAAALDPLPAPIPVTVVGAEGS